MKPIFYTVTAVLGLLCLSARAQTYLTNNTVSAPLAAGTYYHNNNITLNPGFLFTPGTGQSLRLYISPYCVPLALNLSSNQNYIVTTTPKLAGFTNSSQLAGRATCELMQTVQYFDGLGRPLQTVQVKGNPDGTKDVVQPIAYDEFGREAVKYLPYTTPSGSNAGAYRADALNGTSGYSNSAQKMFYSLTGQNYTNINSPMAATVFEPSPLNRVLEQGAPGDAWQPVSSPTATIGRTVKTVYTSNNATAWSADTVNSRQAALYTVTINADQSRTLSRANSNTATYNANELYVTITKDENWIAGRAGTVEEYKDKEGHVVLKRTYNFKNGALERLSTYYVYDDLGNLCFVLPPKADPDNSTTLNSTSGQSLLDNLCYQYRYDQRNRTTQKKLPGKGWEFMVYNKLDQVIITQDANQRNRTPQQVTCTSYDALGRVVMTALVNLSSSVTADANISSPNQGYRQYLERYYNDDPELNPTPGAKWETRDNSTATGYSNVAEPVLTGSSYLSINYYDDYDFPGKPTAYALPLDATTQVRGLPTATKTAVLNPDGTVSGNMLWTVNYYDDEGRNIKTYAQHYLGGTQHVNNYDEITTSYDFIDHVLATNRRHYTNGATGTGGALTLAVTVNNRNEYDHMGRKVKAYQRTGTDSSPEVLIAENVYNETGQLYQKKLHSENGGEPLQTVVYAYNERGWMKTANTNGNTFNMELKYNDVGTGKQFNGNIAYMAYLGGHSASTKDFTYEYDKLNRLTKATSTGNALDEQLAYDVMGNITQLVRGGTGMGTLNYSYLNGGMSNQLGTVTGYSPRTYAYDGNGNATSDGGSQSIEYNMLNLPKAVKNSATSATVATYTYTATGEKLRNTSATDGDRDYIKGIVYHQGAIEQIATEEGKAVPAGPMWNYVYNLDDHLGNARISIDKYNNTARVIQEDEYYSFGLRKPGGYDLANNNRYLYNGKEIQTDLANQYDYGARFYDPVIGRWTSVDLLAEKDRRWSPYSYGHDNLITHIDVDGLFDWVMGQDNKPHFDPNVTSANDKDLKKGQVYLGKNVTYLSTEGNTINLHANGEWNYQLPQLSMSKVPFDQSFEGLQSGIRMMTPLLNAVNTLSVATANLAVGGLGGIAAGVGGGLLAETAGASTYIAKASSSVVSQWASGGGMANIDLVDTFSDTFLSPGAGAILNAAVDVKPFASDGQGITAIGAGKSITQVTFEASAGYALGSFSDQSMRVLGPNNYVNKTAVNALGSLPVNLISPKIKQ